MTSSPVRYGSILGLVAIVALAMGCKKEAGGPRTPPAEALPDDLRPQRAAVDPSKISVPALFAHVPAETPYVMGSFEATPLDYYAKMWRAVGPDLRIGRMMRGFGADVERRQVPGGRRGWGER